MKSATRVTKRPVRRDQRGEISVLLIPLIFAILLFVGAAGFGLWAYSSREDYRLNTEKKIDVAVVAAKRDEGIKKDKEHTEADKLPLKEYAGPEQFGSIKVLYPKTWSGYVQGDSGSTPVDSYFFPGVVPSASDQKSIFALRIKVIDTQYKQAIASFANSQKGVNSVPYAFPKVPKVVGVRFDGVIDQSKKVTGSMIMVPLRDKTLQVYTESSLYTADFNNNILPNLTFSP